MVLSYLMFLSLREDITLHSVIRSSFSSSFLLKNSLIKSPLLQAISTNCFNVVGRIISVKLESVTIVIFEDIRTRRSVQRTIWFTTRQIGRACSSFEMFWLHPSKLHFESFSIEHIRHVVMYDKRTEGTFLFSISSFFPRRN